MTKLSLKKCKVCISNINKFNEYFLIISIQFSSEIKKKFSYLSQYINKNTQFYQINAAFWLNTSKTRIIYHSSNSAENSLRNNKFFCFLLYFYYSTQIIRLSLKQVNILNSKVGFNKVQIPQAYLQLNQFIKSIHVCKKLTNLEFLNFIQYKQNFIYENEGIDFDIENNRQIAQNRF
ncbi:hypothetical protein ABPG72_001523 [Tetrahymena utriculariae]